MRFSSSALSPETLPMRFSLLLLASLLSTGAALAPPPLHLAGRAASPLPAIAAVRPRTRTTAPQAAFMPALPLARARSPVRPSMQEESTPKMGPVPLKYIVLMLLVLQNSLTAILARASRVPSAPGAQLYLGSVAVFVAEVIKLPICIGLIARDVGGFKPMLSQIWTQVFVKWPDTLRMGVPALCYCLQNALFFVALSRLSATSYQLWSQSKTLFTALFFVAYLGQVRAPVPARTLRTRCSRDTEANTHMAS